MRGPVCAPGDRHSIRHSQSWSFQLFDDGLSYISFVRERIQRDLEHLLAERAHQAHAVILGREPLKDIDVLNPDVGKHAIAVRTFSCSEHTVLLCFMQGQMPVRVNGHLDRTMPELMHQPLQRAALIRLPSAHRRAALRFDPTRPISDVGGRHLLDHY